MLRINDYCALKLVDANKYTDFLFVTENGSSQFLTETDLNQTVWNFGENIAKINTISVVKPPLVSKNDLDSTYLEYTNAVVYLKQNKSWNNLFGILVVIKDVTYKNILASKVLFVNDFSATSEINLIDGVFWNEISILKIPKNNNAIIVDIIEVKLTDIEIDTGYIYNYSFNFTSGTALIEDSPMPDYIQAKIELDENNFIKLSTITTETGKTLEKSLLDYFGINNSEIVDIKLNYKLRYGNDINGYLAFTISNDINKYYPLVFAVNLYPFYNSEIILHLTLEINVDSKLMYRETTLTTNVIPLQPEITNGLKFPETVYPVTITKNNIINQTVIEAKEVTKIATIIQPIYAELISDEIVFESKNINFKNNKASYLKLLASGNDKEQIIISSVTSDNTYYFDIKNFIPITTDTTYELIDAQTNSIIGRGSVILKS